MIIEPNTIYTFKLLTGEEFVARVAEIHSDYMLIEHPISTVIGPQGLQMVPALFSANLDEKVRLNNCSWAMLANARQDVKDGWMQATSGLTTVRKSILTG